MTDAQGKRLLSAAQTAQGEKLEIYVADGRITAEVREIQYYERQARSAEKGEEEHGGVESEYRK